MFTARGMKKQTVMHSHGEILFTNKKEGVKKKVRKESIRVCVLATFVMKMQGERGGKYKQLQHFSPWTR